jgi:hypothetical protein
MGDNMTANAGLVPFRPAARDELEVRPDMKTRALRTACAAGQAGAVALLLRHGADPNHPDGDGVYPFDATDSVPIRRLLLAYGFNRRLVNLTTGRGLVALRILATGDPIDELHVLPVQGTDLHLEYRLGEVPGPSGYLRLSGAGAASGYVHRRYGHHRLPGSTAEVVIGLERFIGELQIRAYCAATIAGNAGPREFWLPDLRTPPSSR